MAVADEKEANVPEKESVDEIIEKAAELIDSNEYDDAYDEICKKVTEKPANVRKRNYRDENLVANFLEPEIAEYLSEKVTGDIYYATGSLEKKEKELDKFAEQYLDEEKN